jgi:hypothetical protein
MHSLARRRHRGWRAAVAAAGVSLGIASIGPAGVAKAAVMASGGQRYYLDCGSGNDAGAGTSAQTAWRTLARLGAVTFVPGDSILLRRGTTCGGVLAPQGSGIAGNPIVISAYGSGARPAIAGNGARAALFLHNVQGYEVRHLDISDTTTPDGTARTGIYVLLDDYGIGSHYVISDVNVHDVTGRDGLDSSNENSGGILLKAGGSSVPTGFDGIEVSGSTVSGVDAIGIGTQSQWNQRPLYPAGAGTFVPMTHVHIFGNRLTNLGGDGILVQNGVDPVIEYNVVDGFGLRATQSHAAVLTYNSDHPVMQFNDVSHGASSPPSFAFSVDPGNSDEVYQYNYSHDNGGPFMLFCAVAGTFTDGATIRYNLSVNDHDVVLGSFIIPVIANGCDVPQTNVRFYNNVIYSPTAALLIGSQIDTVIAFSNNIFAGRPAGSTIIDPAGVYDHNLYRDVGPVPPSDTHAVIADPLFLAPGDAAGLAGVLGYLLRCGSPALGAGAAVADNGGRDFYGFPVATGAAPNIGAYQGPCVP